MELKNLNELALKSKDNYESNFLNRDIQLHGEFKNKLRDFLRKEKKGSIKYLDYSSEIITTSGNRIYLPNQWFYIATFMVDFYLELIKYKVIFEEIFTNNEFGIHRKELFKLLKDGTQGESLDNQVKQAIMKYFGGNDDNSALMYSFITDYEWWNGQKTIDRTDFHVSPILKLLGLVNVSQSYVAEIVVFLASDSDLKREAEVLIQQLVAMESVFEETNSYEEIKNIEEEIDIPKNMILYGPPGTGKTFKTVELALKICGYWQEYMHENRNEAVKIFNKLQKEQQIEFVTFHQSISYEEFIEGLSAQVQNGEVFYSVRDGVFKKLCRRANKEIFIEGDSINGLRIINVNDECIVVKGSNGKSSSILIGTIRKLAKTVLEGKNSLDDISNGNIILGDEDQECENTDIVALLVAHYLEFSNQKKNYVIIIDEINRANISKVFGELITIIEQDKRKGAENEISVRLPYSQEYFSIPNNVFIIGTMNTADRSIALMDIALRRRFDFEEVMPQPQLLGSVLLEEEEIDLTCLLERINKRISFLLDRNYSIGQALFNDTKDVAKLVLIIKNKLIPLLQEYFYEDWEKISLILGDNQKNNLSFRIIQKEMNNDSNDLFGSADFTSEDKVIYRINPNFGSDEKVDFYMIKGIYTKESELQYVTNSNC